jgi:hypothetical protein
MFVPIGDVWRSVFVGYERTSNGISIRYDTRASKMIPDRFDFWFSCVMCVENKNKSKLFLVLISMEL